MRAIVITVLLAAGLAGCQTPTDSLVSAEYVCQQSGLRPGTRSYNNCVNASYAENRRNADAAANAVATGVVAGAVGGAVIAASADPYYGGGYYGGPGYYRQGYYGGPYYGRPYYGGGPYYGRRYGY